MKRLVLIHGLAGSTRTFDRLLPLLGAWDVQAVDLPGHGADAANPGADSIEEMAGAVRDVVTEPAVFLGHSMGGLVCTAVAEQDPALVERLVLVNAPPTYESRLTAHRGPERALAFPLLGPLLWHLAGEKRTRAGVASAVALGADVPDVFVEDSRRLTWSTFAAATRAVDEYVSETPLHDRVDALDTGVVVIFGELDRRVALASLDAYRDVVVVRVRSAGHSPIWETPEHVVAALS